MRSWSNRERHSPCHTGTCHRPLLPRARGRWWRRRIGTCLRYALGHTTRSGPPQRRRDKGRSRLLGPYRSRCRWWHRRMRTMVLRIQRRSCRCPCRCRCRDCCRWTHRCKSGRWGRRSSCCCTNCRWPPSSPSGRCRCLRWRPARGLNRCPHWRIGTSSLRTPRRRKRRREPHTPRCKGTCRRTRLARGLNRCPRRSIGSWHPCTRRRMPCRRCPCTQHCKRRSHWVGRFRDRCRKGHR